MGKPKIRLLELRNTYKWGGGPDKTILLSAEQHDASRVEVFVVYVRDVRDKEFQISDRAKSRGFVYYEIFEQGKLDFSVIRKIVEIVKRHEINVIHAHDYKSDLFAWLVRTFWSMNHLSVISTAHGWAITGVKGAVYKYLDLFIMKRFDQLIAVSHATKDAMVKTGIPEKLIRVIHNGVDINVWGPLNNKHACKEQLGFHRREVIVGYVGRLTPEKNLGTWLGIMAKVVKRLTNVRCLIVGDGPTESAKADLQTIASKLGIDDKVSILGFRSDLKSVYSAIDIFFLSSITEGLPNCLLEAMAMGLPVVTTSVGGVVELVVHNKTGFCFSPENIPELEQAIYTLVENHQLREDMGRAGREQVVESFNFSKRLLKIEALYEQMV